ncbi:MAG: RagB/SusD family nutrient uptake outer membrane protein [Cyclobacteriaceae bacterium]
MKKINIYTRRLVLGLAVVLLSCENSDEFLTRVNPNTITPDSFWQTEDDVDKWLTAAYSTFVFGDGASNANFARFFAWASVYRSDEYRSNFGNPWGQANAEFTLDATNPVVRVLWRSFYRTIFRANNVIEQVPLMESLNDQKKNELIGEAEFLRGLSYFYLVNLWESVPLITNVPVSEEEFFPSQASRDQVWAQVITDLTNAKSHLNAVRTRDGADLGRATWGAAIGHLGKAYLYLGQWQNAADEFSELIASNIYDLVPNFRDNCNDLNENNIESIFEAQINDAVSTSYSTWRSRDGGPRIFAANHGVVEPWLVQTFLEETTLGDEVDPRAHATLIFPHPDNTLYGGITYEEAYGTLASDAPAYWKKYRNVETRANDNNGFQSGINIRLMRLGDVLLMHAEAENEANGPTALAQASFNRVRDRADMAAVNTAISKDDFRTAIRRERVLELSGEENRWMDLNRWGILEARFNDPMVLSGQNFNIAKHQYYPIPASEIENNPSLDQYADY